MPEQINFATKSLALQSGDQGRQGEDSNNAAVREGHDMNETSSTVAHSFDRNWIPDTQVPSLMSLLRADFLSPDLPAEGTPASLHRPAGHRNSSLRSIIQEALRVIEDMDDEEEEEAM